MAEEIEPARGTFEKRKPGAKVIDQFGNVERRRRNIAIGISDYCMPPITRKSVATYRGIDADKIDIATGRPAEPVTFMIPGTYMFYDKGHSDLVERNVMMKNLGRPEIVIDPISKKQVYDDQVVEYIEFVQGVKRVDVEKQFALYVFMELHPLNRSNKFRPTDIRPLFERVDLHTTKDLAFQMAEQDLALEAEQTVINMKKNDEIIAYATTAGIPTMEGEGPRSIAAMKMDLRSFARLYPKRFFGMGGDHKAAFKMTIMDAKSWGLIELDTPTKTWLIPLTDEKITPWTYGIQEDPVDGLVNYCMSDQGKALYNAIKNMAEYWAQ